MSSTMQAPLRQFTGGKGSNNRKLSDADRVEIVRLYTTPLPDGSWMGVTAIARQFGVAHNCIQDRLRRAGVTTRNPSEAHVGKRCKPIRNLPVSPAPLCLCGCDQPTEWNQRKNVWNRYVIGHYTQRGEQNQAWVHGRSREPYLPDWPSISRSVRDRDNNTCQRCGLRPSIPHVHHKDCDKRNNDPLNLVTLCGACHGTTHAEMRKGGGA